MLKFRTIHTDTLAVATHLLGDPDKYVTAIGRIPRKTSLDELPQLISIVKGDMSFVGPRPALFNQDDLVELGTRKGIHRLTPGLTGLAQINGWVNCLSRLKLTLTNINSRTDHFFLI
jgi:O-antigen biosynthesis protein WbqP